MKKMWFFYAPIMIFGEDALDHLDNLDCKKVFVVTDPGIIKAGLIDILEKKLKEMGAEHKIFSEVEPDPKETSILKGAKICQEYEPDLLITVGGGSAMDTAKAIWIFYERPELVVDDLHPFSKIETGKKAKLVAIPTTTGTGAETTWAMVITRIADGINSKLEQVNKAAIPSIALLDPRFVQTQPPKLTAMTAFDALAHSYEGFIANWKNDYSDAMTIGAIDLIRKYAAISYKDGNDLEAREKMQNAAAMAGLAFGNSQAIMGHTLGHVFGAVFHIPHGIGVGLFLPYILEFSINNPDSGNVKEWISRLSKMLGIADWSDSDDVACSKTIEDIKKLAKEIDFPMTLKEYGLTKEKLEENMPLITQQCMESAAGAISPRPATTDQYEKIIWYALEGKNIDF
ncbi:MAG: iron-containing alcohol dehydrogenase [archaeon]|nr:iron-containing alcohol dehydrogenase [archaeon]